MDSKPPKDKTKSIPVTSKAKSSEMSRTVTDTGNVFQGSPNCTIARTGSHLPEEIAVWLMDAIIRGVEITAKEDN